MNEVIFRVKVAVLEWTTAVLEFFMGRSFFPYLIQDKLKEKNKDRFLRSLSILELAWLRRMTKNDSELLKRREVECGAEIARLRWLDDDAGVDKH